MSTTALQSRTANIVVPSIHLGSFSPYPSMSNELKQPIHFPEANTIPVPRDEKPATYQPRNPSPWRPNGMSYSPNQSYTYKSFPTKRSSYSPTPTMPRTPTPSGLYPSVLQGTSPGLPVQPPNSPAQLAGPLREVCVECMMRDEDLADVDVTSPGIWERESDVYYHELCAREEEDEGERELNSQPTPSAASSSNGEPRPRAKGAVLTEANLKVWLALNPREPATKQQTLHLYLDSQNALLLAESKARLIAKQESRQLDDKMRDAYSQLRRSAYDLGATASAIDDGGVKIRSPSMDEVKHKRDTTLLENGLIVERVDMRKEEARLRKEERRARKASRDSLGVVDNRDRERDAMSLYSFQGAEGSASLRVPAPYESTASVPIPESSRSVRSMFTTPSSPWQQQLPNRPMSMAQSSGSVPPFASQTSLDSASPRRRFFGFRQWSGYFSSSTSLVPSGSMIDMHLGLDQEKHLAQNAHVDIGSSFSSLREAWPRIEDGTVIPEHATSVPVPSLGKKKKRRGLGRIWKIFTGAQAKADEHQRTDYEAQGAVDDDLPLAPPPPLSYLMNRSNAQLERPMNLGVGRHLSMPSLTSLSPQHPRSSSAPGGTGLSLSSPSEKSSTLPSPTDVRFPYRDSSGDEPEEDDPTGFPAKRAGGSPTHPLLANISESDSSKSSPTPALVSPMPRNCPPSPSSLTPTIKVPHIRPVSVMSLEKSLPPLPPGEFEQPPVQSATLPFAAYNGLPGPKPDFLSEDGARRQSFGGLESRPELPKGARPGARPSLGYDDFGASRHSFVVLDPLPESKRRSRFGLSALLGRKERNSRDKHHRDASGLSSVSGLPQDLSYDQFVTPSMSDQASLQAVHSPRRPLDELVPQDPDFVAYRYPSKDERLDLSWG